MKVVPAATGVVISQSAQVYQSPQAAQVILLYYNLFNYLIIKNGSQSVFKGLSESTEMFLLLL